MTSAGFYRALWRTGLFDTSILERRMQEKDNNARPWCDLELLLDLIRSDRPRPPFTRVSVEIFFGTRVSIQVDGKSSADDASGAMGLFFDILRQSSVLTSSLIQHLVSMLLLNWDSLDTFSATLDPVAYVCSLLIFHSLAPSDSALGPAIEKWVTSAIHSVNNKRFSEALGTLLVICRGVLLDIEELIVRYSISLQNLTQYERSLAFLIGMARGYTYLQANYHKSTILRKHCGSPQENVVTLSNSLMKVLPAHSCLLQYQYMDLLAIVLSVNMWQPQTCSTLVEFLDHIQALSHQVGYKLKIPMRVNPHGFLAISIIRLCSRLKGFVSESLDLLKVKTPAQQNILVTLRTLLQRMQLLITDALNGQAIMAVKSNIFLKDLRSTFPTMYTEFVRPYCCAFIVLLDVCAYLKKNEIEIGLDTMDMQDSLLIIWRSLIVLDVPYLGHTDTKKDLYFHMASGFYYDSLLDFLLSHLNISISDTNLINKLSELDWSTLFKHLAFHTEPILFVFSPDKEYSLEKEMVVGNLHHLRESLIAELNSRSASHRKTRDAVNSIPDGYICGLYALTLIEIYSALWSGRASLSLAFNRKERSIVGRLSQYNPYGYLPRDSFNGLVNFEKEIVKQKSEDKGGIYLFGESAGDTQLYFSSSGPLDTDNCIVSVGPTQDEPLTNSKQSVGISATNFFKFYAELFYSVYEQLSSYMLLEELIMHQEVAYKWASGCFANNPSTSTRTMHVFLVEDVAVPDSLPDLLFRKFVFEIVNLLVSAEDSVSLIEINIYLDFVSALLQKLPDVMFSPSVLNQYIRTGVAIYTKFGFIFSVTADYFASIMSSSFYFEQLLTSAFICNGGQKMLTMIPAISEFFSRVFSHSHFLSALYAHSINHATLKHSDVSFTTTSLSTVLSIILNRTILKFTRNSSLSPQFRPSIDSELSGREYLVINQLETSCLMTELREHLCKLPIWEYKGAATACLRSLFDLLATPPIPLCVDSTMRAQRYILIKDHFIDKYLPDTFRLLNQKVSLVLVPADFGYTELVSAMHGVCIDAHTKKCGIQLSIYFSSCLTHLVIMMKRGASSLLHPLIKGQNCTLETTMTQIQQPVEADVNSLLIDADESCELLNALLTFASNELEFDLAVRVSIFCSDFIHVLASTWPVMLSIHGFSANVILPLPHPSVRPSMVQPLVPLKDTNISGYTLLTTLRTLHTLLYFNQFFMYNSSNLHLRTKYRFHLYRYSYKTVAELSGIRVKSSRSSKKLSKGGFDASLIVCYLSFYYTKAIIAKLIINLVFLLRCDKSNLLTYTDKYLASCLSEMHCIIPYFCDTLYTEPSAKSTMDNPHQSDRKAVADRRFLLTTNRFSRELSFYVSNIMPLIAGISHSGIANPASLYNNQTGSSGFKVLEDDTISTSVLKIIASLGRRHGETLDTSLRLMQFFIPLMDGAKAAIGWFVDVFQTYLYPLRTTLPKNSRIFTLSSRGNRRSNTPSRSTPFYAEHSSTLQHMTPTAGLLWSYQHQNSIFTHYCACKNAFTDTFYDDMLSKEVTSIFIHATSYMDNRNYQKYMNPYYISQSRFKVEQRYQQRDEQEHLLKVSTPAILPDKIPLSADIIANSSFLMSLLQTLASIGLINSNVLVSFADMINKKNIFSELLSYAEDCMLSSTKENALYPTAAIELHALPSKKIPAPHQFLCMAVPSVSVACSLLNSYSCKEIRYVAALKFYYLSHIGKSKTVLAYLLFLTNTLHFDIYSGELLIDIAFHSRLFGLYTLIQLSSLYSKFLTQQQSEIFLSVAVGASVAEELLSLVRNMTLDKLIMYIHGSPFVKQIEQQKYLAVQEVVLKKLANNEVTLKTITSNLLIFFNYMKTGSNADSSPIYALYQELMLSVPGTNHIVIRAYLLYLLILTSGSKDDALFYITNLHFYDTMTNYSAELLRINAGDRDQILSQRLKEFGTALNAKSNIVLLSDPDYIITGICHQKAKCLKSHAKAPYLVFFSTLKSGETANGHSLSESTAHKTVIKGGIFKAGDDVSQDQLTMVLISLFKQIFEPLKMWLSPYIALPIGKDYGFIELLNKASSLDQIGATSDNFLVGYINSITEANREQDGVPRSSQKLSLTVAKRRFLLSYAGYSILSYLLSFKDRHNGNIMITEDCNIIHIDFGFLLEIAPGGKFNTENAPFKLTKAFKTILGGEESTSYMLFQNIFVRGMLLSKIFGRDISYLIEAMLKSNLPAIKGSGSITQFRQRMFLEDSFASAAEQAVQLINESSKKGYGAYDKFQSWQNNITYG